MFSELWQAPPAPKMSVMQLLWLFLFPVPPLNPVTLLNQNLAYISHMSFTHQRPLSFSSRFMYLILHDGIIKPWRKIIRVYVYLCTCVIFYYRCLQNLFAWLLLHLNRIEKVQLSDMGSYQCAVLSEEQEIFSEEGSIQLEGEFIISSIISTKLNPNPPNWDLWKSSFSCFFLSSSTFLRGTPGHVCRSQRVPEPELCGPRPSGAGQGHLAAGWCSPKLPFRPSCTVAFYIQPHRYFLSLSYLSRICGHKVVILHAFTEIMRNAKGLWNE